MSYAQVLRRAIRHLRGKRFFFARPFQYHTAAFTRTVQGVSVYYMFAFCFGVSEISWSWAVLMRSQFVEVLWPFEPFRGYIVPWVIGFGYASWILGALAAAVFPGSRTLRLLHALGVFTIVGLRNSDGHFGHNVFAFLWVSMVLVLLPSLKTAGGKLTREHRHRYMTGFFATQFVICVFYLMTGLWKVRSLIKCAVVPGLVCELSEKVLTNIGAQELIQYRQYAPMAWMLFDYPWLAFFSYMGTIWIHLFSLHFLFRPNLHTPFGFLRVIFHLGTLVLFGVNFASFTWAVIMVFLCSPFYGNEEPIKKIIFEIPPFDILFRWIKRATVPAAK